MSTRDNGGYELDWYVPVAHFCSLIFGDDQCACPSCQIEAHQMPALDGRGEN